MLKIGLFGVGHLGEIHLKCIQNITALTLVGFYDPDEERCKEKTSFYRKTSGQYRSGGGSSVDDGA